MTKQHITKQRIIKQHIIKAPHYKKANKNIGYNIKTREYEDFRESGIIDPTKVTRCALENAASIAGTILLTECTVVNNPEDKEEPQLGGMPGMF